MEPGERMSDELIFDAAEHTVSAERLHAPPGSELPAAAEPVSGSQAWRELLDGLWCLVDRFDRKGRRFWIARQNPLALAGKRRLVAVERRVVNQLVSGVPQKRIAFELGLAESTVSKHAATARNKLGIKTCAELIELYGALSSDGRS